MIKIGDKEQILHASFIVKDDEEISIDVSIDSMVLVLSLTFASTANATSNVSWQGEGNQVRFNFTGWRNPLGTCITDPTKFADLGKRKIYFSAAQYLIGDRNNLVHLFVYLELPNA